MDDFKKEPEARVRRAAKRIGWRLVKSRAKLRHHGDQGQYQLLSDNVVVGGDRFDAGLETCAAWIEEERIRQAA